MIKQIKTYVFDASAQTITFTNESNIELESIQPILNVTRGKAIYNGINSDRGGSVATNVLTLEYNTTAMSDSDDLAIYYDDGTEPATEEKQDTQITEAESTNDKLDDVIEQTAPSTNLEGGGKVSVGTTAVEMTFTLTPKSMRFEADRSNNDIVYYGGSDVDSSGNNAVGSLEANNIEIIEFDDFDESIYFVANSGIQNVWKGAFS